MPIKLKTPLPACISLLTLLILDVSAEPQLQQLSVVFRHGDRLPETFPQRFPNDPNMHASFRPAGSGGLTNVGMRRMYRLGELLRDRYHEFLGPEYEERRLFAVSSSLARTRMSLMIALAAIYPPSLANGSRWHETLDWRPIPISSPAFNRDFIFNTDKCEKSIVEFERVSNLTEVQNKLKEFEKFMEHLQVSVGKSSPLTLNDILILHNNLDIEKRMNLTMETWMKEALADERLRKLRSLYYEITNYNAMLRRFQSGFLLRRITEDMLKARNKISAAYEQLVSLYSGHDKNLISILRALDVYDGHLPEFSSALIFELWSQNENYYVKIVYYLGIPEEFIDLKIPGCEVLCPLDQFITLTKHSQIRDEEKDCVIKTTSYFQSS